METISSKGRWSEEADVLEKFMRRYKNRYDWPELMMRVLARQKVGRRIRTVRT